MLQNLLEYLEYVVLSDYAVIITCEYDLIVNET